MYWTQTNPEPSHPSRATRCLITAEAIKAAEDPRSLSSDIFITQSICSWGGSDRCSRRRWGFRAGVSEWVWRVRTWAGGEEVRGLWWAFHPQRWWKSAVRITTPGQRNPNTPPPSHTHHHQPPLHPLWECGFLHRHTHSGVEVLWNQSVGLFSCKFAFIWTFVRERCVCLCVYGSVCPLVSMCALLIDLLLRVSTPLIKKSIKSARY